MQLWPRRHRRLWDRGGLALLLLLFRLLTPLAALLGARVDTGPDGSYKSRGTGGAPRLALPRPDTKRGGPAAWPAPCPQALHTSAAWLPPPQAHSPLPLPSPLWRRGRQPPSPPAPPFASPTQPASRPRWARSCRGGAGSAAAERRDLPGLQLHERPFMQHATGLLRLPLRHPRPARPRQGPNRGRTLPAGAQEEAAALLHALHSALPPRAGKPPRSHHTRGSISKHRHKLEGHFWRRCLLTGRHLPGR